MNIHGKDIVYKDDDHYLVLYDKRNIAVVDRNIADKKTTIQGSVLGYYGTMINALNGLVEIKVEKQLIGEIDRNLVKSRIDELSNMVDRYKYVFDEMASKLNFSIENNINE